MLLLHAQEHSIIRSNVLVVTANVQIVMGMRGESRLHVNGARVGSAKCDAVYCRDVTATSTGQLCCASLRHAVIEAEHGVIERHRSGQARSVQIAQHCALKCRGWKVEWKERRNVQVDAFHVEKEKRLVFANGPTDRTGILIGI